MEAVIYCINHVEGVDCDGNNLVEDLINNKQGLSAEEAYDYGYHIVVNKVKQANIQYAALLTDFNSYRNQAYYDTVVKGIPAFFLHYDAKFAPQDHRLTLDYPTLRWIGDVEGIDAIEKYLQYTVYEQTFLQALPEAYILKVLELYHADYESLFINVCSIVLRNMLVCMWNKKPIYGISFTQNEVISIQEKISENGQEGTAKTLNKLLQTLIRQGYGDNKELFEYLSYDVHEFSVELWNAVQKDCLDVLLGKKRV
ncbi:DUF6179 domain-containing protein [Anaerosporobacter sp.]